MPPATKKSTREDPGLRRALVINETVRIIGERGYHGFTVQELAKRCRLSNAGLLYYFASKDDLLVAALEELERREREAVDPILQNALRAGAKDPAAGLALLQAIVETGVANPESMRLDFVLRAEAMDSSHPAYEIFRKRDRDVLNLLTKVLTGYASEPRRTARRVYAMMDGLGEQWLRSNQSFDLVEEITSAVLVLAPNLAPKGRRAPAKRARK